MPAIDMDKLPRLKVQGLGWDYSSGGIYDFEKAKHFPYDQNILIVVEGNIIHSYQNLLDLIKEPEYQEKGILNVQFLEHIIGG
jgi:hypothetical protein